MLGLSLAAVVVYQADVATLLSQIAAVGWSTFAAINALFLLYFAADVLNWQAALTMLPRTPRWFCRLWVIRMIGDAYNNVTPTASLGGEAVKVWLLKRHHGVAYRDGGAGIVIARTCTMFGLVAFAVIGSTLLWRRPDIDQHARLLALVSLVVVSGGTTAVFLVQYFKLSTRGAQRLGATRWGRPLVRAIGVIEDLDRRFMNYYAQHRAALVFSITMAFTAWVLGACEAWLVLRALGIAASFADVWIIEGFVQSVRAASFFIPAALGAQEAAIFLLIQWLLGAGAAGIATAIVRRARELLWITLSLLIGTAYAAGPRHLAGLQLTEHEEAAPAPPRGD